MELSSLAATAVDRARSRLVDAGHKGPFLPPHVIDLRADGRIDPHIDSVKFSGDVVAGLSLLAAATMRLDAADPATGLPDPAKADDFVEFRLRPRSFYVLSGPARFHYAHSVFDLAGRRLSLILRDAKLS
mmetsp:Transcript_11101/g.28225  ORF Transcript_11101/g.28225 Transcript_11101/m.28225 type:complete len:130 (+) Transcript_11101:262-651(+)